ncbi:hypothetical protein SAMN02990966_03951 [Rhodospirillales bacterium URHD0017]|nr:hypothetical protein SAMN02990966_03951 [Rhodospirillales bacterium URHD0017]
MERFFRDRGASLGTVVLIVAVICFSQTIISYTITFGALRHSMPRDTPPEVTSLIVVRVGILAVLVALWTLKYKRALFRFIIIANALCTLALLVHTNALLAVLFGSTSLAIHELMFDVMQMAISNVLIFSIWYWIIDPPGVGEIPRANEPWEFLFPQRGSNLPHYDSWVPQYSDYLFVAFTTSLTFSPADAPPLSRRAKMLMLLQATISIVTLTGIAGSAINILAGAE